MSYIPIKESDKGVAVKEETFYTYYVFYPTYYSGYNTYLNTGLKVMTFEEFKKRYPVKCGYTNRSYKEF